MEKRQSKPGQALAGQQCITVQTVYDWLNTIAPFDTAEDFDNAGLLVGNPAKSISRVLFCVDVTSAVIGKAKAQGAELVVSHHPLMFGGAKSLLDVDYEGGLLCAMIREGVSLISAHTNFDRAYGGTSDTLAQVLGLQNSMVVDDFARMGTLPSPMDASELEAHVRKCLKAPVRCYGEAGKTISRIAVGAGAYGEGAQAAFRAGAQAYVTGEIKHHEILAACGQGMVVLDAGHFATEAPGMAALCTCFESAARQNGWNVQPLLFSQAPFTGACLPT